MKHAAAKKRRRGTTVTLKRPKKHQVRVIKGIANDEIKKIYDKSLTPAKNLANFGLMADANDINKAAPPIDKKKAAFVGYAEIPEVKKPKTLSEWDVEYMKALVTKHKDNIKAMFRDIATNYNQLTEAKLQKMYDLYMKDNKQ
jgi:hypothetical protein